MTDKSDLLRQCAASGQMDSAQIAAHERAGELNALAMQTRRVQEHDLRWSREIGYESARPDLNRSDEPTAPAPSAGRALLLYAGTVLASALAGLALFINR